MANPTMPIGEAYEEDGFSVQAERRGRNGNGSMQYRVVGIGATLVLTHDQLVSLFNVIDECLDDWE